MKILEGVELDEGEFRDRAGLSPRMPHLSEQTYDQMAQLANTLRKRLGDGWKYDRSRPDPTFFQDEYYFVVKPGPETGQVRVITMVGNHQVFPTQGSVDALAGKILELISKDTDLGPDAD